MIVRDAIARWPRERISIILSQWDDFERDGSIGECDLRHAAREMIELVGISNASVTTFMRDVAFECYRRLALEPK